MPARCLASSGAGWAGLRDALEERTPPHSPPKRFPGTAAALGFGGFCGLGDF